MIKKLYNLLKIVDKSIIFKLVILNFLFLVNSFLQLIYIYSIFPLVSSLTGYSNESLSHIYKTKDVLNMNNLTDFEFSLIIFIFFSIFANLSTMFTNYLSFNFTYSTTTSVRSFFFKKISGISYLNLITENSSFYTTLLLQQVERVCSNILGSINNIVHQLFLILIISIPLLISNFKISFFLIIFLTIVFILLIFFMKNFFIASGKKISLYIGHRNNLLLQLVKNFREIKIFRLEKNYFENFKYNESRLNIIYKISSFISHSTKPMLEILLILIGSFVFFNFLDLTKVNLQFFSSLSVLIFSFYKLAPAFNSFYSSVNTLNFDKDSINKLEDFLNNFKIVEKKNISLDSIKSIKLKDIKFRYKNVNLNVLKNVSLKLEQNNIYLLSGKSGSGKSTLLNILIGLTNYDSGSLKINDKDFSIYENQFWYKKVAYVTQNINLINDSLMKNIAIGDEQVDIKKIRECLSKVDLFDDLGTRLNENIYENNSNLSGGQLQRIGIARALYKESEFLIFDEPTSNLDPASEKIITKLINSLRKDRIIVVVSHKIVSNIDYTKHFNILEGEIREN